ncbi:bleomycin resistance protein [Pseudanabaena sp. UWO311]|uniref:VOC family protein n=1 Tax=Pseudanabaena sp. UWO311 TaxID=2487337 RepID=UPI001159B595|nr:VOC family protein [Pseudanabaena sp. UWO311]TYQ24577.1 bleomycin resistance protein [Pseudanabaena sp. UWO311]
MSKILLNLVVIRSNNIDKSAAFYQLLGMSFVKHQHGKGLEHFASEIGCITFEIYPLVTEAESISTIRLGFQVTSLEAAVSELKKYGASIISAPANSPWGWRAVVSDPDGNRVELTEI